MAHSVKEETLDQSTGRISIEDRDTPIVARTRTSTPEPLPRNFGRYELQRFLGKGAMGIVYLAHDSNLDRLVALKIPRPLDEDPTLWRERFLTEARAAATLHHPNICPVFEVGETDSQLYLTMAYIEGETLAQHLRRSGSLPIVQAVELVRNISRAMAEAHERGIVHRDLKPANIMLDRRGQPVIMDFGLALRSTTSDDLRLTLSGVAMGTPCYMPPEQAGGDHAAIGPPADVYSLGVILFELVTGRVPFQGRTFGKLLAQIERDAVPSPRTINPEIDERLNCIILKALAKAPEERFPSAAALADALDGFLRGDPAPSGSLDGKRMNETADWRPSSVAKVTASDSLGGWSRNWRLWSTIAGGALLVVFLGVVLYVLTDNGTLVVELSDPAAAVVIKVNGKEVILDHDGSSVRVRAGKNQQLEVSGPNYHSTSDSFDLKRGGETVVHVTLIPKTAPPQVVQRPSRTQPTAPPPQQAKFSAPGLIETPGWHLLTGASQDQMQAWLDERQKMNHSVLWLDVAMIGEKPVFAAVAALDNRADDWRAFLDLSDQEVNDYVALSKRLDTTNYTVTSIGGYFEGKKLTGVALYHRGKSDGMAGVPNMFNAKMNLNQAVANDFVARVVRPVTTSSGQLFCGMFVEGAVNTRSRHGLELTEAELAKMLEVQREEGAYPVSFVPYEAKGQTRFAVTFREDEAITTWEVVRDMTTAQLKSKAAEFAKKNLRPASICVYPQNGEGRYAAVFCEESRQGPEGASPKTKSKDK
jgi:serine/threonine protein kinase